MISNSFLQTALFEFKKNEGTISDNFELGFLSPNEKKNFENAKSKLSLYKALLVKHIAKGIKSGEINFTHSFHYQSFESYLIDSKHWNENKNLILNEINLVDKKSWHNVQEKLKKSLQVAYNETFDNLNLPHNPFVETRKKDKKPRFITPLSQGIDIDSNDLFPKEGSVSILEILNTVNQRTNFTTAFTHWSNKSIPKKPTDMELFAIIISYGCNIGVNNMAKNTTNVSANTLINTSNWYFSLENIQKVNDIVVDFTDNLKIVNFLQTEQQKVHTSSDGQKFYVKADSIHANYSFKYFGKDKGIVMYSFIDNLHRLFYATAFSSSEREAHYVLDGLMHNEIIQSDMHSTDTHGYTELVFALTYLLDIEFAPRIANFQDNQLFTFSDISIPVLEKYIIDVKKLNTDRIEKQWDTLLKMASTIKLKNISASTLFKRLNSYAQQNETYLALRDLGRLVRTKFLLNYMNDPNLRQMIQQQLNKGESSNQLARHIFYGNNGQIKYTSKEEHLRATACKTLIHNLIICWNYMYLSKLIFRTEIKERLDLFQKIKKISPVRWEHINFYGVFDFSDDALKDALYFDSEELFNFDIE